MTHSVGTPCKRYPERGPIMRTIRTTLRCLLAVVACLGAANAYSGDGNIYVYAADNGSRLITDHPRVEAGYRLIKIYSESNLWDQTAAQRAPLKPRPSAYDGLITRTARRVSLDPLLIKSVMHAESDFDPNAVSRRGARGLMQLMPATARRYGVSHVFDPRENVMAGARYLSDLLDRFDGRLELALAGYNAGEHAVSQTGGIPPYDETRRYVKKVMHLYREYRNDKCRQEVDDAVSIRGTIISCSSSYTTTADSGDTTPSAQASSAQVTPSRSQSREPSPPSTLVSAGDSSRQWRPIE